MSARVVLGAERCERFEFGDTLLKVEVVGLMMDWIRDVWEGEEVRMAVEFST